MSGGTLDAVIAVLVVWNVALTVGLLVAIRQIVVLGLRDRPPQGSPSPGGTLLALNKPMPEAVIDAVPAARNQPVALLFLSVGCDRCRRIAQQCADRTDRSFDVVAVVPGREGDLDWLRMVMPVEIPVLTGPTADSVAAALDPMPAPFLVYAEAGLIQGWMQVADWTEVERQIAESRQDGPAVPGQPLELLTPPAQEGR
jgi:hypothetical protein